MKKLNILIVFFVASYAALGQVDAPLAKAERPTEAASPAGNQKVVIVTGARFTYPLVQQWIDEFSKARPDIQVIIDARGSSDPAKFDVLAEVYEQEPAVKETRQYLKVGRYAIVPVANASSAFGNTFAKKGLNTQLIKQIYFHDIFADEEEKGRISEPYTVYTRLQKAGAPIVFSKYFSYQQKDIQGKGIAGSDEHLLKALLRDSTAVSFLPLPVIFKKDNGQVVDGLTVLPVDLDGNKKVSDDEKIYGTMANAVEKIGQWGSRNIKNLPIEYLHLSVDKKNASPEALAFLKWVSENGHRYLETFGYLQPENAQLERENLRAFESNRGH